MRFDQVSLARLQHTQRQIEGRCFECDAVLHVELESVIAAHGETATLAKVATPSFARSVRQLGYS